MDPLSEKQAKRVVDHSVDAGYEAVMDSAALRTLTTAPWIAAQRNAAPARLSELLKLRSRERDRAVATEPRFQTYALASYLLEKGEAAIPYDPSFALDLVRLARAVTVRVDPRTCGGLLALTDLGAYALAWEANTQRVRGNLTAAIATFSRSRQVQERGGGDPDITARMDLMEASLQRDTGQYRTALDLLDHASEDLLSLSESDLWIKAQISRSNVLHAKEEFDQAAMILEGLLEKTSKPDMLLYIHHNLASLLARSGQPREAVVWHDKAHELYRQFPAPLFTNRRHWLEGIIASDLGQDERAGSLLENAGSDFEERGYGLDAALIRNELERVRGRSARLTDH
jgi:tetratricopeptide (TPR) repeat protein